MAVEICQPVHVKDSFQVRLCAKKLRLVVTGLEGRLHTEPSCDLNIRVSSISSRRRRKSWGRFEWGRSVRRGQCRFPKPGSRDVLSDWIQSGAADGNLLYSPKR